ncbi:MAG: hypothetical protein KAR47_10415 [Planctomycetes bacterium]|nr:hypothetical protein [Planctomycetota bacterium]
MAKKTKSRVNVPQPIDEGFIIALSERMRPYLNAATGLSQIIADELPGSEQKQDLLDIARAGGEIASLLNDAIELCRIQSGEVTAQVRQCSLEELFSEICAIMQARAGGKGLEFAFVQSTAIPTAIQCDRSLLLKCLLNLANSAIARTEDGYVHIKVSVLDGDNGSSISFDFVDSSPTTSLKKAGEMFKPFSADQPADMLFASGGMELAICSALVEIMAGTLSVAKNPGRGLVISLVIPTGVDMVAVELLAQTEPEKALCGELKTK